MTAVVLRGDARRLPLPDASVDLICCSPPYFGLRSYSDGGVHYEDQIGSEATPAEWLAALLDCTRDWIRVLKPSGSIFVNLGDKFSTSMYSRTGTVRNVPQPDGEWSKGPRRGGEPNLQPAPQDPGVPPKSLLGLPWRYALACMDELGLILRRDIIWSKPNGLPESVTDRCRSSHEYLFHFTVRPRYYAAVDEIREPHVYGTPNSPGSIKSPHGQGFSRRAAETDYRVERDHHAANPLGKLPGSVWEIPSQPLSVPAHLGVDHFAAFPMELPRRVILGWSPPGVCTECGEGRRPVAQADGESYYQAAGKTGRDVITRADFTPGCGGNTRTAAGTVPSFPVRTRTITGYACACPDATAPVRPAVVVDPFGGTGTTALVASMYGRLGFSFDLSMDYARLAKWRTSDPGERARALGVSKPPKQVDGQGDLFSIDEAAG